MITREKIRTKDGFKISSTLFRPETDNGKVIVIGPAAALTQNEYFPFAQFLYNIGYVVCTYDYRGIGESSPGDLRGFKAALHEWSNQDTDAVLLDIRHRFPKHELIYMAHGISGEIIGLAPASQFINRMVILSAGLTCRRYLPLKNRIRLGALKSFSRLMNLLFGYFPGSRVNILGDLPKGVVKDWIHWCNQPNGLFDLYPDTNFKRMNITIQVISFADDWRTPEKSVEALLSYYEGARINWIHMVPGQPGLEKTEYPCFFHKEHEMTLWSSLIQWIELDEWPSHLHAVSVSRIQDKQIHQND